jgi:cytochrome c556
MKFAVSALFAAALSVAAVPVLAQDFNAQVKARQGQFRILAINLGILGGMAKGDTPYDAATAKAAADSVVAVTMINQAPLWPKGSDNVAMKGTNALPAIWENPADLGAKWQALADAAKGLQAATDAAGIGAALGPVGATCKACHDANRAPLG